MTLGVMEASPESDIKSFIAAAGVRLSGQALRSNRCIQDEL
jgi:hypothetical protein